MHGRGGWWRTAHAWRRRPLRVIGALSLLAAGGVFGWVFVHHAHLQSPRVSAWLDDRNGNFVGQLASPDDGDVYGYWPVHRVPPRVEATMLALEDRRFGWHPGIDPIAVARAAIQNLRHGRRVSGASTIAMQIARMQLDRHLAARERSWWRKGLEAVTAVALTAKFDHATLLRHYLTITPFGNRSHGMLHASEWYFDKPLADLSWAEIAFLAAIPNAPTLNNPHRARGRDRLRARAARNLDWLREQQVIERAAHAQALQQLARLQVVPRRVRPRTALHVLEQVRGELPRTGRRQKLTLDLSLQARAHAMLDQHIDAWRRDGATNAAAMVVDLRACAVRVRLGSVDYFDTDHAGAIDHAAIARSPGSTLKPFIYALGLERKAIAPDTIMDDLPVAAGFANADHRYLGPVLPRQALANSRNLPVIRLLRALGVARTGWALHRMGVTDGRPDSMYRHGLGLALGVMPVSLAQLTQAYTAFAHDGRQCALDWRERGAVPILRATDLGASSARRVSLFLSDPQARLPAFKRLGATDLPANVAVKTGTSQNFRDAWTFAWSRDLLVGVWVGRHDARPMRALGGATSAAQLAGALMTRLAPRMAPEFATPAGAKRYAVCAYTGDAVAAGCARPVMEWLDEPPRQRLPVTVAVDTRTERPASRHTPAKFVAVRSVARVPARFGPWLARLSAPRSALEVGQQGRAPTPDRASIRIVSPAAGVSFIRVPGVAAELQSIGLRALTSDPSSELVWFVDGVPVATATRAQIPRWTLQPGRHVFTVQIAGTHMVSAPVAITVQ